MNDGVKSAFTGCRTFDSLRLLGHASIFQQLSHLRGGDQLPAYPRTVLPWVIAASSLSCHDPRSVAAR